MEQRRRTAREVFGERAAYYTTSASHTDAEVLARVVELCEPSPGDVAETYTRHRPISSLTDNVSPENTTKIMEIIASLDEEQRRAMNVVEKDGVTYINHWFVMLRGRIPGEDA